MTEPEMKPKQRRLLYVESKKGGWRWEDEEGEVWELYNSGLSFLALVGAVSVATWIGLLLFLAAVGVHHMSDKL